MCQDSFSAHKKPYPLDTRLTAEGVTMRPSQMADLTLSAGVIQHGTECLTSRFGEYDHDQLSEDRGESS
jgi:hypothetical protein